MRERTIYITNRCPHECSFCSTDAKPDGVTFLTLDEIREWLDRENPDWVHVSGGEPLLNPWFIHIWRFVRDRMGDNCTLWTNDIPNIGYNAHVRPSIGLHKAVLVTEDDTVLHVLPRIHQGAARRAPEVHIAGCNCGDCDHKVLLPDGREAPAPCRKEE
jgi:hypothetical protein